MEEKIFKLDLGRVGIWSLETGGKGQNEMSKVPEYIIFKERK